MPSSNLLLASKAIVVEEPPRIRNIPSAATAICGMVGITERGPVGVPTFVTSPKEYAKTFGGYIAESDLPQAVDGFFLNGGVGLWITRTMHYTDITDPNTYTGVKGTQDINDRGGAATAAILDSAVGPFDLAHGEVLEINIDGGGADTLTFQAQPAQGVGANGETFNVNGLALTYQTRLPGSTTLQEAKTITFSAGGEIANPAAATAQEIVNYVNARAVGIIAVVSGSGSDEVTIQSVKRGTNATLVLSGTALTPLGIAAATTNGSGNVADINAVTATEIAALLTALTIAAGTATAVDGKVRLASTATGTGADVVVTANTTALGIFAGSLPITQTGSASGLSPTLRVRGKYVGPYINDYEVVIEAPTSGEADRFNLRVTKNGIQQDNELFPNLSMDDTDARYVETIVNAGSNLIEVVDLDSAATAPNDRPALGTHDSWASADDGLTGLADTDFIGSAAGATGLYAFDEVDDLTLVTIPGRATSAVHNALISYCEVQRNKTCFAVLGPPSGLDEQGIKTYVESTAGLLELSEFAAIYWPRIKIVNPSKTIFGSVEQIVCPPEGHIMGVYSRADQSKPGGVYEAPAGLDRNYGVVFGALGFETDDTLDERKRDVVYPSRINPITRLKGTPIHIDGNRTLKSTDSFPTVGERRGVIFIETSAKRGVLFAKHRQNTPRLRQEVKRSLDTFLLRQFQNGAFRGATPAESFYVDVSEETANPPEVVLAGELRALIGLATAKPTDWVILTVTQDTRALEERLATLGLG